MRIGAGLLGSCRTPQWVVSCLSVPHTEGPSVLGYFCASAASCCVLLLWDSALIPGLLGLLHCVRQLESILTLIFQGADLYSCCRNAFSWAGGKFRVEEECFWGTLCEALFWTAAWNFLWGFFFTPGRLHVCISSPSYSVSDQLGR